MNKNQQYPIFVQWFDTLDWILENVDKFPKSVRNSVSNRVSNYALEILDKIIEAIYTKNHKDILMDINLLLEKLRVFYHLSYRRKYISQSQYQYISQELNATGKMIGGWNKVNP